MPRRIAPRRRTLLALRRPSPPRTRATWPTLDSLPNADELRARREVNRAKRAYISHIMAKLSRRPHALQLDEKLVYELVHSPCAYCGSDDSVNGLDRKDSGLDYTRENTVPCCVTCNTFKGNLSVGAFITAARERAAAWAKFALRDTDFQRTCSNCEQKKADAEFTAVQGNVCSDCCTSKMHLRSADAASNTT